MLQKSEDAGIVNVIVDLEKGGELFPTDLAFYVVLKNEVEKRTGQIVLTNLSILTMKKVVIAKLDTVFTITETLGEAIDLISHESNSDDT